MRITSGHIIELAAAATSRQQSNVADATNVASSGMRVQQASDDPSAWAAAQRDRVREALSQGNAQTISSARETMDQTDGALTTISGMVAQARSLAVQGANSTYSASQRADMGTQVQALFESALAAANAQTGDGSYVLAGTKSSTAPFDANGDYQGDATDRSAPTGEHNSSTMNVAGSVLTVASGIDVLPELKKLATALSTNDLVGIQAGVDALSKVTDQVSTARARVGTGLAALNDADTAQQALSMHLQGFVSSLVEADTVTAASTLARATQALQISQTVTSHVISTLANNG
jgi:flagellar hook-associated protein 3 FlgL